ncbi:uncharacterized protein [Panulirus ornatus]|uniref:uncharacterized protein n=1 Tax=Panulirus ornatus TaxID=150431 RepID=UPI003A848391
MKWLAVGSLLCLLCLAQGREAEDGRLIAARSTKTAIVLTTSTTAAPFTCALATNAAACQRRRYRRYSSLNTHTLAADGLLLDGSMDDDVVGEGGGRPLANPREGRVALVVWTTLSSTFTVTATSINSSTTFSLSFFCTVNGAALPPACG